MKEFNDKVVVITGGATGIGFSFAKRFGTAGAKVVIAGRRQDKLDAAVTRPGSTRVWKPPASHAMSVTMHR